MRHGPQKILWIAVLDGAKALIYRNAGDAQIPVLKLVTSRKHDDPPSRELGSDRPGRMPDQGGHRTAMDEGDLHAHAEAVFLRKVIDHLNRAAEAGEYDQLLIYGAKQALGVIRPEYTDVLKQRLLDEFDLDITNEPVDKIEERVAEAL